MKTYQRLRSLFCVILKVENYSRYTHFIRKGNSHEQDQFGYSWCQDMSTAMKFYKNLGFEASVMGREEVIGIVFFRMNGSKLALYPLEKLASETGHETGFTKRQFNGITLAFNVKSKEEVDLILKDVTRFGGEVVRPAAPTEWGGYGGYFTDIDGYYWEVAYGADWEFDEKDMLII